MPEEDAREALRWAEIGAVGSGALRDPAAVLRRWRSDLTARDREDAPAPTARELVTRFAAMGIPVVRGNAKTDEAAPVTAGPRAEGGDDDQQS